MAFERETREAVIVAEAREPRGHRAVGEERGLEDVGGDLAHAAARIGPRAAPTEDLQHLRDRLDARQHEARAVALVGRRGEHPRAAGPPEIERVFNRAHAVDVEVDGLNGERFSGRGKKRVDELLGGDAPRRGRGEQRAGLGERAVGGALVGVRV